MAGCNECGGAGLPLGRAAANAAADMYAEQAETLLARLTRGGEQMGRGYGKRTKDDRRRDAYREGVKDSIEVLRALAKKVTGRGPVNGARRRVLEEAARELEDTIGPDDPTASMTGEKEPDHA